ncbi:hypothetical protein EI77_01306 [Prosthecobacter fusiformis]|uniref:Uncharacterized protein n=1 Tax=Prosthecobacter fusiformis TaxID=48464 RepID=A0A4R7S374_9BACT|nr:hypothetical protein [Prosthecobacter fusiformis]TDU72840.1 hypothetical protein EI77_01306 [Prosthecobacter fusiformis]
MTARPLFLHRSSLIAIALGAVQLMSLSSVFAQYGASPTQTGLFFDDLRARQKAEKAATTDDTRDGDVTYDYDSGVYRANDDGGDTMGRRTTDYESAREVSRPSVRSGSSAFAARTVGDYTNYAGQYTSPTGFFAPTYISDPFLSGRRNVRLGPINVGFGLYQGFEYNDNVNRSGTNPEEDFISTTLLNIDANYQITQNNRLSLSTAIGFDHYFNNPDLAPYGGGDFVLNVLPGSTLAFDIKAGPVYITIYNRTSVRPAARNDFALTRSQVFGVLQNDTGVAANWRINSAWTLAMNYMHSIASPLDTEQNDGVDPVDDTNNFGRTTDSLHGSLSFSPSGTWVLGAEGGITSLKYDGRFNNDGTLLNAGAFLVIPVGDKTYIRLAGGYQHFEFKDIATLADGTFPRIGPVPATAAPLTNEDNSDLSDFYYGVTISNQLNSRVSQSLNFGRESSLNVTSNYITSNYINYGMSIIAWKGSRVSLSGYYEQAEGSGGVYAQELSQYGLDAYLSHRINSKITAGFGYHFGRTDTNAVGDKAIRGNFDQHALNFDITYALSPKSSMVLGYRFFMTDVTTGPRFDDQDFEQNRIILGFNYNF